MSDLRGLLDPTRISEWIEAVRGTPPSEVEGALITVAALEKALSLRVSADPGPTKSEPPAPGDRLLTAREAAERLGVTERWLRGRCLPFRVQVSSRQIRFSESGLLKWLRTQNRLA